MDYKKLGRSFQMYYGGLQFEYFTITSALLSFTSVFLLPHGFTLSEVGIVLALGNLIAVFIQPFFADYADQTEKYTVDQLLSIGTVVIMMLCAFLFVFTGRSVALAVFYVLTIGGHIAIQPFLYDLNFRLEQTGVKMNFGACRSMGSIGFSCMSAVLGAVVEKHGILSVPAAAEIMMAVMLINIYFLQKKMKKAKLQANQEVEETKKEEKITLKDFVKGHKILMWLNVGVMFVVFHNTLFCGFMLPIMESVGGNSETMGKALSFMAILEVPGMLLFDKLQKTHGSVKLLKVSLCGFLLKNILFLTAKSVTGLYIAQAAQMIGFAFFMPSMVSYIHERTKKGEEVKGQALFTTMFTAGGIFGNLFGGIFIDSFGVTKTIQICLAVTVIGVLMILATADRVPTVEKNA